jgi:hypothetical protein
MRRLWEPGERECDVEQPADHAESRGMGCVFEPQAVEERAGVRRGRGCVATRSVTLDAVGHTIYPLAFGEVCTRLAVPDHQKKLLYPR